MRMMDSSLQSRTTVFCDCMQGVKSRPACRKAAGVWAKVFSEQEGKYAANLEADHDGPDRRTRRIAPIVHYYSGTPAQYNG